MKKQKPNTQDGFVVKNGDLIWYINGDTCHGADFVKGGYIQRGYMIFKCKANALKYLKEHEFDVIPVSLHGISFHKAKIEILPGQPLYTFTAEILGGASNIIRAVNILPIVGWANLLKIPVKVAEGLIKK